jgi:hypothetical protein
VVEATAHGTKFVVIALQFAAIAGKSTSNKLDRFVNKTFSRRIDFGSRRKSWLRFVTVCAEVRVPKFMM